MRVYAPSVVLVLLCIICVISGCKDYQYKYYCDRTIPIPSSVDEVTLLYTVPDYEDIRAFDNQTELIGHFPILIETREQLEKTINLSRLSPDAKQRLSTIDFGFQSIAIIQDMHHSKGGMSYDGHKTTENLLTFCFKKEWPNEGDDEYVVPQQFVFIIDFKQDHEE